MSQEEWIVGCFSYSSHLSKRGWCHMYHPILGRNPGAAAIIPASNGAPAGPQTGRSWGDRNGVLLMICTYIIIHILYNTLIYWFNNITNKHIQYFDKHSNSQWYYGVRQWQTVLFKIQKIRRWQIQDSRLSSIVSIVAPVTTALRFGNSGGPDVATDEIHTGLEARREANIWHGLLGCQQRHLMWLKQCHKPPPKSQ